jgi:hypothetical protein
MDRTRGGQRERPHEVAFSEKLQRRRLRFYFVKLYRRESPAELVLFGAGDEGENAL